MKPIKAWAIVNDRDRLVDCGWGIPHRIFGLRAEAAGERLAGERVVRVEIHEMPGKPADAGTTCPKHPRYQVKRAPRSTCQPCWRLWQNSQTGRDS